MKAIKFIHNPDRIRTSLKHFSASSVFVLTDENTQRHCLPLIRSYLPGHFTEIEIKSGEENKNIHTTEEIWKQLIRANADRESILINLGGGVITDIGGFAAATFKRGIRFVNIPTTLMGMADASVGGKTGVDVMNSKNQAGVFKEAELVLIWPEFLKSIDERNIYNGFAEVIKQALLSGDKEAWKKILRSDIMKDELSVLVKAAVKFKSKIVDADPYEKNKRKILNFGHTIGHALESSCLKNKIPAQHGFCVAFGMIAELRLSVLLLKFSPEKFNSIAQFIKKNYASYFPMADEKEMIKFLSHDKKNVKGKVNFVLLRDTGKPVVDQVVPEEKIREVIRFTNELIG